MANILTSNQLVELRTVFDLFDKDHDGFISQKEFKAARSELRDRHNTGWDIQLKKVMAGSDVDGDARVSFEEFVDAAAFNTTYVTGQSTDEFNRFIRLVTKFHLPRNYDKNYLINYSCWPPPFFMIIISIVQIAVYAVFASRECDNKSQFECPLSFSSDLAFRPGCREEVWRFITYVFVHATITHILFNVLIQLLIGIPLEMVHGPFRVLGLYFLGAFYASLASSVFDPDANVVGASGAVYALLGAHLADLIINWAEMPFRYTRAALLFVLMGLDLAQSIYNRYFNEETKSISYTGHFAGGVIGCTLGVAILKNLQENAYEKVLLWIGVALSVVFFIIGVFFNIFHDYNLKSCP